MGVTADRTGNREGSVGPSVASACHTDLSIQTRAAQDAIRLTQLGARAGLVAQLTGLEKAVANRLYRQQHGRPSPPGQLPFTDSWYLKQDRRMLQATLVWHLSQRSARSDASPARRLIAVYESYCWLEPRPLLDIMRVAFVPHLVAMQDWQAQTCALCAIQYLPPRGSVGNTCWGCRRYLRHRCRQCGSPLAVRPGWGSAPGGLRRLPTDASPTGIRNMALKRIVLWAAPRSRMPKLRRAPTTKASGPTHTPYANGRHDGGRSDHRERMASGHASRHDPGTVCAAHRVVLEADPTRRYLQAQELAVMLAVHRSTLWGWVNDGHLPCPVRLGPNTVAWDSTEIDAWLAAREGAEQAGSACNGDN